MARKRPPYHEDLLERVKDPVYAVEYLEAALEEDMLEVFLLALRNVAEARGIECIARETKLKRENLYAMLSEHGHSVLSSFKLEEGTQDLPLDANTNRYSLRCAFLDKQHNSL